MSSVHISIAVRAVDPDTDPDDNEPESAWLVQDNAIHLIDNTAIPNNDYPMHFDRVFDRNVSNEVVYNDIVAPLISDVTRGYNGSLMVCGPSFISKQFTMEDMFTDAGLIPRAIEQIFKIASKEKKRGNFIIRCSNIMLYKDKVYDLLRFSAKEVNIVTVEHGKVTIGAKEAVVSTKNQATDVFQLGLVNRDLYQENGTMDATVCDMIFRIIVEHTEKGKDNKLIVHSGCLNMVTLGGSDAGPNQPGTSTSNSDAQ
nr:kinesin-like protein KIN-7L [Onthophagus taurus]